MPHTALARAQLTQEHTPKRCITCDKASADLGETDILLWNEGGLYYTCGTVTGAPSRQCSKPAWLAHGAARGAGGLPPAKRQKIYRTPDENRESHPPCM